MQINIDVNIDVTIVYNNLVVLNVKVNLKPPSLTVINPVYKLSSRLKQTTGSG
jgi:hypothetical protein